MPKSVSLFLFYLLPCTKDDAHSSKRTQRLVSSFGQDMVYAITYGKTKFPKHIILPFAIKSLTGNVGLIHTVNRLGHSVSYSQLDLVTVYPTHSSIWSQCILLPARLGHSVSYSQLDLVTVYPTPSSTWSQCILLPARLGHSVSYSQLDLVTVYPTHSSIWSQCILLPARLSHSVSYSQLDLVTVYPTPSSTWSQCILLPARLGHSVSYSQLEEIYKKLSLSVGDVPLPANIYPGVFTTLAWNNIDRLEETISGEGTSHSVNVIAVQTKLVDPQPLKVMLSVDQTRKFSISTPPLMLPMYNVGQREGVQHEPQVSRLTPKLWFSLPERRTSSGSWHACQDKKICQHSDSRRCYCRSRQCGVPTHHQCSRYVYSYCQRGAQPVTDHYVVFRVDSGRVCL